MKKVNKWGTTESERKCSERMYPSPNMHSNYLANNLLHDTFYVKLMFQMLKNTGYIKKKIAIVL